MSLPRRQLLADQLRAFGGLVFVDADAHQHRGRWQAVFRDRIGPAFNGRVIFEVGCADADFITRIARAQPQTGFVGLDWKYRSLHAGAERIRQCGLANVILLRGRAQDISSMFAPGELDEVWVFHPDPCDKPRELRNRLISEPFLVAVSAALRGTGSRLCLKTDHAGYYQWVLALLGLPEPDHFDPASAGAAADDPARSVPRLRRGDLMSAQDLPPPSPAVQARFRVSVNSPDFWNDPAAQALTAARFFAGEVTAFEHRFRRKRLPIYYVELSPTR